MANFSIIDTHTHNYFSSWEDVDALFARGVEAGVIAQVQIGADEAASYAAIELAKKYPNCYATVGVHPTDVKLIGNPDPEFRSKTLNYEPVAQNQEELFALLEKWIEGNPGRVVGVGECGYDWHHDLREEMFAAQNEAFRRHIELAKKYDLPIVVHTRNAIEDTIEFFKKHIVGQGIRGVVHCFSEELVAAKFFTEEAGFYLGIGGIVTYKKSDVLRDVVREIDLKYLVTETDSPFLPPQNWRKKNSVNESASLVEVVEMIADVKGMGVQEVAAQLVENGRALYRFLGRI